MDKAQFDAKKQFDAIVEREAKDIFKNDLSPEIKIKLIVKEGRLAKNDNARHMERGYFFRKKHR
jgi:hypothetical protein